MAHVKDKARRRIRIEASVERERVALEMFLRGQRYSEIAEKITVHHASVGAIIRRALERRASEEQPTVAAARELYLMRANELLRAWWPLAVGTYVTDDETGATAAPDPRAADIVMKLIDKIGAVMGQGVVQQAGNLGQIDLVHRIDDSQVNTFRQQIMSSLAAIAQKNHVIDAEFDDVGTTLQGAAGRPEIDTKPAPPRTREKAA
jgi:hypothetical protein